jgi:hypothetical protein
MPVDGEVVTDLRWTVVAPYRQCLECWHPGPPAKVWAITIAQPSGANEFNLIPHHEGCSAPNPFNGPSATITFNDMSAIEW